MRGWLVGGLSALMLMGAAGAAAAQEVGASETSVLTEEDLAGIASLAQQLDDGIQTLGLETGVDVPSFKPLFEALVRDVFTGIPDGEDYGFSVGFDFTQSETDEGPLEDDPERRIVLESAQACADSQGGIAVIHFERITRDGMKGHRCIIAGPDDEDPGAWVFLSTVVLTSAGRHLDIRVAAAATSEEGGYDRARAIGESQLEDLIALAAGIDKTAMDLFLAAPSEPAP